MQVEEEEEEEEGRKSRASFGSYARLDVFPVRMDRVERNGCVVRTRNGVGSPRSTARGDTTQTSPRGTGGRDRARRGRPDRKDLVVLRVRRTPGVLVQCTRGRERRQGSRRARCRRIHVPLLAKGRFLQKNAAHRTRDRQQHAFLDPREVLGHPRLEEHQSVRTPSKDREAAPNRRFTSGRRTPGEPSAPEEKERRIGTSGLRGPYGISRAIRGRHHRTGAVERLLRRAVPDRSNHSFRKRRRLPDRMDRHPDLEGRRRLRILRRIRQHPAQGVQGDRKGRMDRQVSSSAGERILHGGWKPRAEVPARTQQEGRHTGAGPSRSAHHRDGEPADLRAAHQAPGAVRGGHRRKRKGAGGHLGTERTLGMRGQRNRRCRRPGRLRGSPDAAHAAHAGGRSQGRHAGSIPPTRSEDVAGDGNHCSAGGDGDCLVPPLPVPCQGSVRRAAQGALAEPPTIGGPGAAPTEQLHPVVERFQRRNDVRTGRERGWQLSGG
eukprot:scaffold626_cov337-Pavlova_lutheri.AAC.20